jgi:hypothetical protein
MLTTKQAAVLLLWKHITFAVIPSSWCLWQLFCLSFWNFIQWCGTGYGYGCVLNLLCAVVEPYGIMIMAIVCYCLMSVEVDSFAWSGCLIMGRQLPPLLSKLLLAMFLWHLLVSQLLIGCVLCGEFFNDSVSSPASGAWSSLVCLDHITIGFSSSLLLNLHLSYGVYVTELSLVEEFHVLAYNNYLSMSNHNRSWKILS